MLGPSLQRPGEAALVAAVQGTGAAQQDLVPALMRCYVAADFVVGLDVDKVHSTLSSISADAALCRLLWLVCRAYVKVFPASSLGWLGMAALAEACVGPLPADFAQKCLATCNECGLCLQDNFDKFGFRNCIDRILMELWKDAGALARWCEHANSSYWA